MSDQTATGIRPRTKSERMALLSGFAMCLEMVERHGLGSARNEFRLMAECEGLPDTDGGTDGPDGY